MGSIIEINDTLQITREQGFPAELDVQRHLLQPYTLADVESKTFTFRAKPKIRVYQQPPVRNFLVQNIDGKWIYWGKCHILEIHHNYIRQETSGTFQIIELNTPADMQKAFDLIDLNPVNNYFSQMQTA